MKYLKKFESFDSTDNILTKYYSEREYNDIVKVISEIESYSDTFVPRKNDNVVYNTIMESRLFAFYKDYYLKLGQKIKIVPIPSDIYEYETVINNINLIISKTDAISLLRQQLIQLKNLIVYLSYFPNIRKNENKRVPVDEEIFELFSEFDESKSDYISKRLSDNRGAIRNVLFFCDSEMEISTIERTYLRKMDSIDWYEDHIKKYYTTLYNRRIKDKPFEDQLYYFKEFFPRVEYTFEQIFHTKPNVDDYRNNVILAKFTSFFSKNEREPQVFEFTGDLVEDYRRYTEAYEKNR